MAYLNALGYYEKDKDIIFHNLLDHTIQDSVYTRYTYEIIKAGVRNRNMQNFEFDIENGNYYATLRDRNGNDKVQCNGTPFDEMYYEEGTLFKKTYIIFHGIVNLEN